MLIEGRKEEISILELCQRCIEYGMKKSHMEDECPFKLANEEIEKILMIIEKDLMFVSVSILREFIYSRL